ncbi:MAG: class I SAM-dependent methyltransferase [Bacteroidota bacterium]
MSNEPTNRKLHWETIYGTKSPTEVSWYQPETRLSLDMIRKIAPDVSSAIIDVGGGASLLVDELTGAGYQNITVLDVSAAAFEVSRKRLGERSKDIEWIVGDVLDATLQAGAFNLWHDRAVFHFLLTNDERRRYIAQVKHALRSDGHVVIATFAENGPTRCSGLEVCRYSSENLMAEFGDDFVLLQSFKEDHRTPSGNVQRFQYSLFGFKSR